MSGFEWAVWLPVFSSCSVRPPLVARHLWLDKHHISPLRNICLQLCAGEEDNIVWIFTHICCNQASIQKRVWGNTDANFAAREKREREREREKGKVSAPSRQENAGASRLVSNQTRGPPFMCRPQSRMRDRLWKFIVNDDRKHKKRILSLFLFEKLNSTFFVTLISILRTFSENISEIFFRSNGKKYSLVQVCWAA